jgi:hypothetical protein
VEQAEGTSTVEQAEGTSTADQAEGRSTTAKAEGTSTVEQAEGTSTADQAEGTSTVEQAEGTSSRRATVLTLGVDLEGYHGFRLPMAVAGDDGVGASEVELGARYLQPVLRTVTHPTELRGVPVIVGLEKHRTLLQVPAKFRRSLTFETVTAGSTSASKGKRSS